VDIPVIEQAKIQAQVLVPLVKALQAELGKERANALVRKALGDVYRRLAEQWWRAKQSRHVGENLTLAFASFAKGDALDYTVRGQSEDIFEFDVTRCLTRMSPLGSPMSQMKSIASVRPSPRNVRLAANCGNACHDDIRAGIFWASRFGRLQDRRGC